MANWRPLFYIATDNKPTDNGYSWWDYSRYLRDDKSTAISTRSGRQDETQHHNNGQMTVSLDNREYVFNKATNAWVSPDTPVKYALEYPWLPGLIPNGGFDRRTTEKWSAHPTASTFQITYDRASAADAGGAYAATSLNSGEGIWTDPIDLTATFGNPSDTYDDVYSDVYTGIVGLGPLPFVLTLRGIVTTPGVQVRIEVFWYEDTACTVLASTDIFTTAVNAFYWDGVTPNAVFKAWVREAFSTVSAPGSLGARVRLSNVSGVALAACYFDSVVFDVATFQGIFPQYAGYADSWDRTWEVGDGVCSMQADDGFKPLSKTDLSTITYSRFILEEGDPSSGVITENTLSCRPVHYYQLNEAGANNQATNFKDSISGDTRAISMIGKGVGSLYQVAGLVPTDAAGAWSSLGPSSDDSGWILVPGDMGLTVSGSSWAAAAWVRVVESTADVRQWVFLEGQFTTLSGFRNPLTQDGVVLYVEKSNVLGATDQTIRFWSWGGLDLNTGIYSNGSSGLISAEIHDAHGFDFWDQAPHFIGVKANGNHWTLYFDGQVVYDGVTGTAATPAGTPPPLFLGKKSGFFLVNGTEGAAFSEQLEYQHVLVYSGALPTDADMATMFTRASQIFPQEDSGSRLQRILDMARWPGSLRNIDVGSSLVEKIAVPFSNENAHSYNQRVEDSEQGWMFIGNDGRFRWKNRQSFFKNRAATGVFGTGPGEIPIADATITDEDSLLYNQGITSRSNNGPKHTANDIPSQDDHFISSLERSNLLLVSENETEAAAETIVNKYGEQKETLVQVILEATAGKPIGQDAVLSQIFQREIGDRIIVRTREPGQIGYTEWTVIIQGIGHDASRGKLTCTWDVTTLWVLDYFLFGDVFGSRPMGW